MRLRTLDDGKLPLGLWTYIPYFLMLLGILFLYRRLVAGWVLAGGDLQTYFFPYWTAAVRAFQAGRLPLWNPDLFVGAPLLANSQAGVFYPLNWPLWWLSGSSLGGMARTLHWSVLLHLGLAALNASLLARRLGLTRWSAALSSLLYAGSGYLGIHVEHLNQLQGLAWLPLVLLPVDGAQKFARRQTVDGRGERERGKWGWPAPVSVGALAMIVLAGHTQMAFIAAVGLIVWVVGRELNGKWQIGKSSKEQPASSVQHPAPSRQLNVPRLPSTVYRLLPYSLAGLIAAAQLLPTVELSRYSMRSGGLPWREAVSFSVRPWELLRALVPPYFTALLLPEAVAYIGLVGMALAVWGAWHALRTRKAYSLALILLGGVGVFCALGGYNPLYLAAVRLGVPGFVHFRAPVRFLALYVLAATLLAGMGFDALRQGLGSHLFNVPRGSSDPRLYASIGDLAIPAKHSDAGRNSHWSVLASCLVPLVLTGAVCAELLWSAEQMPHADATTSRAYTDLRPATAHLVAATRADAERDLPPGRFLSITPTLFEAGDEADIEAVYGAALSPDALWAYEVAVKQREVLAPNLSLAFEVPAVDGYDGGLLPLRHYVAFSRLFLPEGTLDGRLRENLTAVPEGRWLSLLGVRFLMTDKTGDLWVDGVFYDRQFQPHLEAGETLTLAWLPRDFAADALGWLYAGAGEVQVTSADGTTRAFPLPAQETADIAYRLPLDEVTTVTALTVRAAADGLTLTGASLIDGRTGAFYPLVVSEDFHLVHSGDVKIYENLHVLPHAFLIQDAQCVASDDAALDVMRNPAFDPAMQATVVNCDAPVVETRADASTSFAMVVEYAPERVVVDVVADAPALVILTDAWYPGWQADVQPLAPGAATAVRAEVLRTDLLFRGVKVEPGAWRITFTYRSTWLAIGIGVSVLGVMTLIVYIYFSCIIVRTRI
ncbi:MAG: hypothetical protein JXR84_23700 [Anaerolineae bacterium]|nr:hypothetical protein [Anaerolineae bacterium]